MTANKNVKPFKFSIPSSELNLLHKKVLLTRLPKSLSDATWTPDSNFVNPNLLESMHQTWLTNYSWKEAEEKLNSLPQFITKTPVSGFGDLDIQFVHSPSAASLNGKKPIPLLFLHGWPGSIIEVSKALPIFNEKCFDVVAPSLPGWLSSMTPCDNGFKVKHHAKTAHKLMLKLDYGKYVLQGGDWGGEIAPTLATLYPESVMGMHVNYFPVHPEPRFVSKEEKNVEESGYTAFEKNSLGCFREWKKNGTAYVQIQQSKPLTLGVGLHDSPMGLLAWIADKILDYDAEPAGPFQMYVENRFESEGGEWEGNEYVEVPTGVSALRWENEMVSRKWAEREANVVWWREHERGGHFAVYEMLEEMVQDVAEFVDSLGIVNQFSLSCALSRFGKLVALAQAPITLGSINSPEHPE